MIVTAISWFTLLAAANPKKNPFEYAGKKETLNS